MGKILNKTALGICVLAACASLTACSNVAQHAAVATAKVAEVSALPANITGGAFMVWQSGNSQILRGQKIFLCKDHLLQAIGSDPQFVHILDWKPEKYAGRNIGGVDSYQGDAYTFTALKGAVDRVVASETVQSTETDIDGKYVLPNVAPGNYVLFSQFINPRPEHETEWCFWILPVGMKGSAKQIDLSTSKLAKVVTVYDLPKD